jgi:hypothetical protein
MLQVQSRMCETCIYKKNSPLNLKTLEKQVTDRYGFFKTFRACHHAGRKVCCRGFWNRHKDKFQLGQIAQRLNMVKFVTVDTLKETKNG